MMKTYILNPSLTGREKFIREGRCMQKASSWATSWPPISLALLGTLAKVHGDVRLLDGNIEELTLPRLLRDVGSFSPDLLVVNTGFPSIDLDMDIARQIKASFPKIKVLAFGVYFTMLGREAYANYSFLDFCLVGEPEQTFLELTAALAEQRTDFSKISGLMYRDESGVRVTPPRAFMEDLDQLPMPDRSLLKNERYRLPQNNRIYTLINTARGCPHRCTYCIVHSYYGNKIRKHSIDYVIREIKTCIDTFGIRDFLLWEEVFSLDSQYVLELCGAILENGLRIRWAATTRVGSLTDEVVAAMKRAGCYLIGLGIETSSQDILDRAKKKQTIAEVLRAVAICQKHKLSTMGHFIFGLPGETRETAEQTIRFLLSLGLDYMQCYCAVPYPQTELGALAKASGWITAERWSQYDFGGASIMNTDTLTSAEVDAFREQAFSRFYLRPSYIVKKLFTDLSILSLLRIAAFCDWIGLFGFGRKK